jgi:hypothetical protein
MAPKPWRLASSLARLREQINTLSPNRSRVSDGTIGDASHASRASDHNPWVVIKDDGRDTGIVTALDITDDPKHGVDASDFAQKLLDSKDSRIKYIISDRRIASGDEGPNPWKWRKYEGKNPHTHHFHISVKSDRRDFDKDDMWRLAVDVPPEESEKPETCPEHPVLARGTKGSDVAYLQRLLSAKGYLIEIDSDFGPKTEIHVKAFQKKQGMKADGIVGPYTWEALEAV